MKSHSHRKAVRQHGNATGEGHLEAVRAADAGRPRSMADCDPAEVPAPVAVMMARNLHAARLHLSAVYRLAQNNGVLPPFRSDKRTRLAARLEAALDQLFDRVRDLRDWSERTAHHAGAVDSVPDILNNDKASKTARQALYPQVEGADGDRWCAADGGRMPLPGESHIDFDPHSAPDAIRHTLPGPVPEWHLSAHATGIKVRKAGDIAPGTPSAPIWLAHDMMSRYLGSWMYRGGDSPVDLAVALDGLRELADALPSAVEAIIAEIERRTADGRLRGVDQTRLADAKAKFVAMTAESNKEDHGRRNHLRNAITGIRGALTGAAPSLPVKPGMRAALERITPRFTGRTAIQIRAELGQEAFGQRQVSKTRAADYGRHDLLVRMLAWMHATGATEYDAEAHLATEA